MKQLEMIRKIKEGYGAPVPETECTTLKHQARQDTGAQCGLAEGCVKARTVCRVIREGQRMLEERHWILEAISIVVGQDELNLEWVIEGASDDDGKYRGKG